jgi:predicted permease
MTADIEGCFEDLRHAARALFHNPVYALSAVGAIALGMGATTAVFSTVDRVLFRALPYAREDRLVSVGMMAPLDTNEFMFADELTDLRHNPGPFAEVTSFEAGARACDLNQQNPVRLACLRVAANFLETLGMPLAAGRSFSAAEDLPNGPRVAMISYGLWQSRLAGDRHAIGRTLVLDGAAVTVVGVLPKDFETPTLARADVLVPQALNEAAEHSGRAFRVFARLKLGIGVAQATAQLGPHFARALQTVPPQFRKEVHLRVRPVRDRQVGEARLASLALFCAVLAVLLIACANVANLMLARAVVRQRDIAVRLALGAPRWRLVRQALSESLLLAAIGGAAGCALAYGLVRAFASMAPGALPHLEEASIDGRVLAFTALASIGAGILFGMAPALRFPSGTLAGGWRSIGPARGGLRSVLVAAQIAASLVLLTGAGLTLRSLWKLASVPLGMEAEHVVTAHFVLGRQLYQRDVDQLAFFNRLEQRLQALPGTQATAITDSLPPIGGTRGRPFSTIAVEGVPPRPEGTGGMVSWRYVTPGYFAALGIPILRGRGFTEADRDADARSVILDESLARRLFPGRDPVGGHILEDHGVWYTVVGVSRVVRNRGLSADADPEYYVLRKPVIDDNFRRAEPPTGWRETTVVVRTSLSPALVVRELRQALASLDRTLPVETETMQERLVQVTARPRFYAWLLGLFAAIALALAAFGLFGVMSFLVARRIREFGVRVALGATPAAIMRAALGNAARWVGAGILCGIAGSLAVARSLRSILYRADAVDPAVLAAGVALLAAVALVAAIIPARRAARLQPLEALREE